MPAEETETTVEPEGVTVPAEPDDEDDGESGPKILSGGGWGKDGTDGGKPKEQPRAGLGSGTSPPAREDKWVLTAHITLHSTLADDDAVEEIRGMLVVQPVASRGDHRPAGARTRSDTSRSTPW